MIIGVQNAWQSHTISRLTLHLHDKQVCFIAETSQAAAPAQERDIHLTKSSLINLKRILKVFYCGISEQYVFHKQTTML